MAESGSSPNSLGASHTSELAKCRASDYSRQMPNLNLMPDPIILGRTSQFAHQQLCNFQAIEALKRMGAQINPFNDNLPINFPSERQTVP